MATLAVCALVAVGGADGAGAGAAAGTADEGGGTVVSRGEWIVSAEQAVHRISAGALVLDARGPSHFEKGHVLGARPVDWGAFSRSGRHQRGRLSSDDAELAERLAALGVEDRRPTVVVGDPHNGWGEEGRIVWMLRTLGHGNVAMVDGGHAALVAAGATQTRERSRAAPGHFSIRREPRWSVDEAGLRDLLEDDAAPNVVVDARDGREYQGATPHGEKRGGHVPSAVHLHYRELLDERGFLRSRTELEVLLAEVGVRRELGVVAYCTGGVRSAWLVVVLVELGFTDVRSYAGSMWEWSALPRGTHPLVE